MFTFGRNVGGGGGSSSITTAKLVKTGQSVSYRTGDDGDLEAGRDTSFTVLAENNPFGNTNRFTDELGGQTYTNNIVIDWSTYDGSSVLGYKKTKNGSYVNWSTAIDNSLSTSLGSFTTGWRLPNKRELENILNFGASTSVLNYAPFSIAADTNVWTSTTNNLNTANAFAVASTGNGGVSSIGKGIVVAEYIPCRTFTVTGTTLS